MSCLVSSVRGGSRSPGSVGEARRLAEVGVVGQLVEHEPGDVGTRDLELQPLLGGREAVPVLALAPAVGEGRRTDYRPIQGAVLDVRLLLLVVGECAPQQQPEHDVLPEEVEVARTLAGSERALADESPHARPLHRPYYVPRTLRTDPALPASADGAQHGPPTPHRPLHRSAVQNVTPEDRQPLVLHFQPGWIPHKRLDLVPPLEPLPDDVPTNAPRRPEDQYLHRTPFLCFTSCKLTRRKANLYFTTCQVESRQPGIGSSRRRGGVLGGGLGRK